MTNAVSICLVQTPCYELDDDRLEAPMGLLYLASWLEKHGYDVAVCDLSSVQPNEWITHIPDANVYGFSTYTPTYYRTLRILRRIKLRNPMAKTVAGGPHASALPNEVGKHFDHVVVGEGENALLALMDAYRKKSDPPPVLYESRLVDLDSLPFPAYRCVDVRSYHRLTDGRPSVSILSSRGCPYHCVFCNSIVMNGVARLRFRSPQNVAQEVHELKERLGFTSLRFQDDTFTLNLPRLANLMELLRAEGVTYRCFGRLDRCTAKMAESLYASGCRHIAFGAESGSPAMLARMRKRQTVPDIRRGIACAKAAGLIVRVYLLVGFPGETWETVQETVELMAHCRPNEFVVYPLIPYPGTELFNNPHKFGITKINTDFSQYLQLGRDRRTGFVFQTNDLDEKKISEMRMYMIESLEEVITWAGDSKQFR